MYNAVISVVVFFSTPEHGTDKLSIHVHVHVYSYMYTMMLSRKPFIYQDDKFCDHQDNCLSEISVVFMAFFSLIF